MQIAKERISDFVPAVWSLDPSILCYYVTVAFYRQQAVHSGTATRHSMLNSHKCGIFPAASPPPSLPPIHTPSRPVAAARDAVIQHKNKTFYLSDQIFGGKIWESNYKWFNYNNIIR